MTHTTQKTRTRVTECQEARNTAGLTQKPRIPLNEHQRASDTANTTHKACTPGKKQEGSMDTTQSCTPRPTRVQATTNYIQRVGRTGATQPISSASTMGGTPRPLL